VFSFNDGGCNEGGCMPCDFRICFANTQLTSNAKLNYFLELSNVNLTKFVKEYNNIYDIK
jgi:hypothetical protein